MLLFGYFLKTDGNEIVGRSYVFATFAVNSMIYIFAYRSMRRSIFRSGNLMHNKPLVVAVVAGLLLAFVAFLVPPIRDLLELAPLTWGQWGVIFAIAFSLLVVVEIGKFVSDRRRRPATNPLLGESFERKLA